MGLRTPRKVTQVSDSVVASQPLNILFLLGIALLGGTLGARFFQRLRIPQVIGYIAIGILVGESGLKLIRLDLVEALRPLNYCALGIIGFLIGGELSADIFKRYGKQFFGILLGEGIGAFVLVGAATGLFGFVLTHNVALSVVLGIVMGAISSATDPVSTIEVLREYRTRGVLTTAVIAVVALDDVLALMLYGLGSTIAGIIVAGSGSVWVGIGRVGVELFGSLLWGCLAGVVLNHVLRWMKDPEKTLAMALGTVLMVIGVSAMLGMDIILSAMALGVTLVNMAPRRSADVFSLVRKFSSPIYVLFFVLVGAQLALGHARSWIWALVAIYFVVRSVGKIAGAYFGAKLSEAPRSVTRYSGLCLLPQGGVAIGLSLVAGQHLADSGLEFQGIPLGTLIVTVITAATCIVQLLGPPCVKLGAKLASEIGLGVTTDDLVAEYTVADVMDKHPLTIREGTRLHDVLQLFGDTDRSAGPVVDDGGTVVGVLGLESLLKTFVDPSFRHWLLAADLMTPAEDRTAPQAPLAEALQLMSEIHVDYLPVVETTETGKLHNGGKLAGLLELGFVNRRIREESIRRHKRASQTGAG